MMHNLCRLRPRPDHVRDLRRRAGRPGFVPSGAAWTTTFASILEIILWEIGFHVSAGAVGADVFATPVDRFSMERVSDRVAV